MQKTRLGISVGLMGFITYFACYFGGFVAATILFGYILLVENNPWIRKTAVKAMLLTVVFAVLPAVIGLIPDALSFIGRFVDLFGGAFNFSVVSKIVDILIAAVRLAEAVIFIVLGIKALRQGTINVPVVDDMMNSHME